MILFLEIQAYSFYLFNTAIVFIGIASLLFIFILFYLLFFRKRKKADQSLIQNFADVVSEICICETKEEMLAYMQQPPTQQMVNGWLANTRQRVILIHQLIAFHKQINGIAAQNVVWLYQYLMLKDDSLKGLTSRQWQIKARAIQELAEMEQQDCITKIYRYTNHKNFYVRTEAQVAVVKLTGFDGLRFLNVISQPLTQWQQLCLMQQLATYFNIDNEKLAQWLQSNNVTVIEFALKLAKAYNVHEVHDAVVNCLQHSSAIIRLEAIYTLQEIAQEATPNLLMTHFNNAARAEQIAVLQVLKKVGTVEQLPFLEILVEEVTDMVIRNEANLVIREIGPVYGGHLQLNAIKNKEVA